jgi:two-component system, OmpR family, response regulator RpaA
MSRVLIIEDEPVLARLLQLLVEVEGYETIVADDGIRGFAAAQRQAPDAILMDLMMPVMDGYGTLEALRTDERTADIPVVVLSAIASDTARQRCIDSGAVAIVRKPFDSEHLLGALGDALASHRATEPFEIRV